MKFKGIQELTKSVGGYMTKNSPTLLTGLSVAGLITTTVMAVKATPKALSILDQEHYERFEKKCQDNPDRDVTADKLEKMDVIKLTWKCYVPTAIMGAATIGCLLGANSISLRRNAALAGAYSLAETTLKEYQAKVVETIGKNKEKEIKDELRQEKIRKNPVSNNEVIITGRGDVLCYDNITGRYFKSDMETIETALNKMSRRLMNENYLSLNEVYSELGLEGTKAGDMMGFYSDKGLIEADFSSVISEDGKPCLVMDFEVGPSYCDRDY